MNLGETIGACVGIELSEASLFTGVPRQQSWAARKYCANCPIRLKCLAEALKMDDTATRNSLWGGHTPEERKLIRKGVKVSPPEPLPIGIGTPRTAKNQITSQYYGVSFGRNRKWRACIKIPGGKTKYLGTFPFTAEGEREAALAYDRVAWLYRGDQARLNFGRPEGAADGMGEQTREEELHA